MSRRRSKAQAQSRSSLERSVWMVPLVLIATAIVFAPAVNFQFVYDDRYQIAQNPSITSWSYLPQYFTSHIWSYSSTLTNYYRPIFLVVLRAWNELVGLDPVGWHALPVVVHLLNVALVFVLVRKLSNDAATGLIASALFAVHPVQIEAVASIYGVTDAVMATWLLLSFWMYLRWRESSRAGWLAGTAMAFAVALLTKESAVVFPVVLLAYEVTTATSAEGHGRRSRLLSSAPAFLLVTGVYFVARRCALGAVLGQTVTDVSWTTVLLTIPISVVTMVRLWLLPYGMSAFYVSPYVRRLDLMHFVLPLVLLIAIAAGAWFWARRTGTPLILFAAIWAVLGLVPVLNIRLMQEGDFIHIRFLYLPSVALSMLAAIALRQLIREGRYRIAAAGVVVVTLAVATRAQMGFLQDNEAMYRRGIEIAPDNRVPKNNLADDYIKAGRIEEATVLLDDNLRRHPDFWMSNYDRGYIAYTKQEWPLVVRYMDAAIINGCTEVDAYVYRGFAQLRLGKPKEAEESVRQAIALRPQAHSYHFVLGLVLREEQKWNEALEAFQQELAIDPGNKNAAIHVADLRARLGRKS